MDGWKYGVGGKQGIEGGLEGGMNIRRDEEQGTYG